MPGNMVLTYYSNSVPYNSKLINGKYKMAKKKSLDIYSKWKSISVVVNDLSLDPNNVRLGLNSGDLSKIDQGSIINDLFSNENAFQILENVVNNGWFVDEIPIVIKEKNKYIVLEGNRRIAALKTLQNPVLIPEYFAKVKPLADSVLPIKKIDVLLAPNRIDASSLLASRHTKVTARPWKPLRQAHFYYSQLKKGATVKELENKYKGVDIVKFIKMCEIHAIASSYEFDDTTTNNKVRNQRVFPVSTVERLYDDSKFREHLNFDFNRYGKLKINSSKKRFDEEFKKVILDAVEKRIDTRTLNTEKNRRIYFEANTDKLNRSNKSTTTRQYRPNLPVKQKKRSSTGLLDRKLICTLNCRGIERVLNELQTLNYRKFPNAAHDLMRSFLEAVLKEYLKIKKHKIIPRRAGGYIFFDDVLKETEKYFKSLNKHQEKQIVTEIRKDKDIFDCINHNPSIFSTGEKVKNGADQMSDLIKFIFEDCK